MDHSESLNCHARRGTMFDERENSPRYVLIFSDLDELEDQMCFYSIGLDFQTEREGESLSRHLTFPEDDISHSGKSISDVNEIIYRQPAPFNGHSHWKKRRES